MMMRDDLFPDLLLQGNSSADVESARALAWALVESWFGTLRYPHNQSTHSEIIDSLNWPGMAEFVRDAALHVQDAMIDFDEFADGVRAWARKARAEGLVRPDGLPRRRQRVSGPDLFELEV